MWLDRSEFDSIIEYLNTEAGNATRANVEKEIVKDLKKLWKGDAESRAAEVADIAAAVMTLANVAVFEHPALFRFLTNTASAGHSVGMD
jgi:NTP pyrophosphatase (non-canonical NTP hydrolase)